MDPPQDHFDVLYGSVEVIEFQISTQYEGGLEQGFRITTEIESDSDFYKYVTIDQVAEVFYEVQIATIKVTVDGVVAQASEQLNQEADL